MSACARVHMGGAMEKPYSEPAQTSLGGNDRSGVVLRPF